MTPNSEEATAGFKSSYVVTLRLNQLSNWEIEEVQKKLRIKSAPKITLWVSTKTIVPVLAFEER
jgi:hypothetical protein